TANAADQSTPGSKRIYKRFVGRKVSRAAGYRCRVKREHDSIAARRCRVRIRRGSFNSNRKGGRRAEHQRSKARRGYGDSIILLSVNVAFRSRLVLLRDDSTVGTYTT